MARPFQGQQYIQAAQEQRDNAKTAQQLRQALAVLLPLECGLNLQQTAQVLGRSREATCRLRTGFFAAQQATPSRAQLPSPAKARLSKQAAILDEVLADAAQGGVVVVPPLKALVEAKLGKTICLATLYNMLHRHGWRKLAPDTVQPKGDPQAREDWKKNCPPTWHKSS